LSLSSLDLQQPELMSNERLVEALAKIKVPIPVYSDGSPSRERLLYLYRTYILPQPQRVRHQWRRKARHREPGTEKREITMGRYSLKAM